MLICPDVMLKEKFSVGRIALYRPGHPEPIELHTITKSQADAIKDTADPEHIKIRLIDE